MFEKVEVYPYQRLNETTLTTRSTNKLKGKLLEKVNFKKFRPNLSWYSEFASVFTIYNIILGFGALILARALVLEEILPFIFAYIAAFGKQDLKKNILLAVFAILGFSSLLQGTFLFSNLITLLILVGILSYIKIPYAKMWWGLPILTVGVLIIAKTILGIAFGTNLYLQMVIVFEAMIAGIITFVFMVSYDVLEKRTPLVNFSFEEMAAFVILGIGIVIGFSELYLGGLNLGSIICRLGILVAAFIWGSGGGTMVGVMAGIIPSISSHLFAPTLAMYAISGLLAGLFRFFGRLGVIIGFMLGTLALSVFIIETKLTIIGIWETAIACIIFFVLPTSLKEQLPIKSLGGISSLSNDNFNSLDTRLKETTYNKMEKLANVFEELSSTFVEEDNVTISKGENSYLNYLYEEISHNFCENCSRYGSCWGEDCYSTSQEILDLFTLVESNGVLIYEDSPIEFRRRCINGREMVSNINYLFDNLRLNEYWVGKLNDTKDLVATQLKGVSQVIKGLADDIDISTTIDFALRESLLKECVRLGMDDIVDITPIKNGLDDYYLNVTATSCGSGATCESHFAVVLSSLMQEKLEVLTKDCPRFRGKSPCEFTLTRAFTYKVYSGAAQVGKEKICGDSFTIATLKEGKELIALSDGMGIGEQAMLESQTAVRLLESLLSSGFTREVALKTINSVLLLRSNKEAFATLDMLIFDLYSGEVDFIKIGSAPSFIKRDNRVGVITANSLPMGILNEVDINMEKNFLLPRDLVVMVSDGVLEIFREDEGNSFWVVDFLASLDETDPQIVANTILHKALSLSSGQPADDMTVICSYIDLNFSH